MEPPHGTLLCGEVISFYAHSGARNGNMINFHESENGTFLYALTSLQCLHSILDLVEQTNPISIIVKGEPIRRQSITCLLR